MLHRSISTLTLRLSGSSALPAYPGFMVMKTAQVGFSESSVPSKMNIFSFRIMACWMLRICWATTDSTSTCRDNAQLRCAQPASPLTQQGRTSATWELGLYAQNGEHDLGLWQRKGKQYVLVYGHVYVWCGVCGQDISTALYLSLTPKRHSLSTSSNRMLLFLISTLSK